MLRGFGQGGTSPRRPLLRCRRHSLAARGSGFRRETFGSEHQDMTDRYFQTQNAPKETVMIDTCPDELRFTACGREWILRRASLEALWEHMDDESGPLWKGWQEDERLPYWAELWPSSLALAAWLAEHRTDIAGKRCLDMGCGLGFTALAGRWLGAEVIGMDYDAEALRYARINAELNAVEGVDWRRMDWREPELPAGGMDVIWAGDIVYERRFAEPIAAFLAYALTAGGRAWIAEPGRAVFACLPEVLPRHGLVCRRLRTTPTLPLYRQDVPVPVSIWEITRG